jgi:two-component system, cell cycle response regulator DivK
MQYRSCPNDRSSLGDQRALFNRKPTRQSAPKMQMPLTGRLARTPTVLVADDNDDTRQMLQILLAARGYRVLEAIDGEQTVEVIQRENPGLVLLDLGLPRLNGLRVIHRLRSELKLIDVPLVVISGYDNHFDTALAAGCDDYLVKPIDFDRLEVILDYYVPTRLNAASA